MNKKITLGLCFMLTKQLCWAAELGTPQKPPSQETEYRIVRTASRRVIQGVLIAGMSFLALAALNKAENACHSESAQPQESFFVPCQWLRPLELTTKITGTGGAILSGFNALRLLCTANSSEKKS